MDRYARQARFQPLGSNGQQQLHQATVAVLGLGATGSTVFQTLLRAGIGQLRIADRDWVEAHNLPRQQLYTESDVYDHTPKAVAAAIHGARINSACVIHPFVCDLNATTIAEVVGQADLIIDGADNLELRYLINEWCVRSATPWIYTGVLGAHGMTATFRPGMACFRCVFPAAPPPGQQPTCETAGVLGSVVGVMGNLAATEAIKLLAGAQSLNPGLFMVDGWNWSFDSLPLPPPRPDCPVCGLHQWALLEHDTAGAAMLCGRNAVQVRPGLPTFIDLALLEQRLHTAGCATRRNEYLLRCAVESYELTIFPDGRAIISGTDDLARARSMYARWVGA